MKNIFYLLLYSLLAINCSSRAITPLPEIKTKEEIKLPIGGNTWVADKSFDKLITKNGIQNWQGSSQVFTTYFFVASKGDLRLGITAKTEGLCQLRIKIGKAQKEITIQGRDWKTYDVGDWKIADSGYLAIELTGANKEGDHWADVSSYELSGTCVNDRTAFVKNDEGNFFYWGRRGPSVHLNYAFPDSIQAEWFYNEITVPKGNDIVGSYFMADGFGEGYFGIQVNSDQERRVLFSVWSPFSTDDPKNIPPDQQVKLLAKGKNVHAGEFGNEGSGGQSYLKYNWVAGNTYKFLLSGKPSDDNTTIYTAYFFAPELNKWQLIASFARPKTQTYLKRFHSFLENFIPSMGDQVRKVYFGNQWVRSSKGEWHELTNAVFTYDNTAAKGYRLDYSGGVDNGLFFLKNGGFFSNRIMYKSQFLRPPTGKIPDINWNDLPKE